MKKRILALALSCCLAAACTDYDDFEFTGTVVDCESCIGLTEFGYVVSLSAPDTIGGSYLTTSGVTTTNTIFIYGADRLLKEGNRITGRIYLDPNYSKATCHYHYPDRDLPEAVFTKLELL